MQIASSDAQALREATRIAEAFASGYKREDVVGIVFLWAIVRGYFDRSADVDIGIFTRPPTGSDLPPLLQHIEGFPVHSWVADYQTEQSATWDMAKRWAYSESRVFWDPSGAVARLVGDKVALVPAERKWLMVSGAALSGWYTQELTQTWIQRGSLLSAHSMFLEGLNQYYNMLFSLNGALVPADKWKVFYAERLPIVPDRLSERLADVLRTSEISEAELRRRMKAFVDLWQPMVGLVEREVGMSYREFKDSV